MWCHFVPSASKTLLRKVLAAYVQPRRAMVVGYELPTVRGRLKDSGCTRPVPNLYPSWLSDRKPSWGRE